MWAFGRFELRLSENAFWRLTFAQLDKLAEHYLNAEDMKNFRAGQICATIANVYRGKGKRAYKPSDFIGRPQKRKKQTADEMLSTVKGVNAMLQGTEG